MPINIFISYAHEDEKLKIELEKQLSLLRWQRLISVWHDRDISAGADWQREINEYLNHAQIILLLVSPDFMASEYCYGIEMQRAMERHERGEAQVIPVILRPIYWQDAPFGKLQALPTDANPVTGSRWHNLDEALFSVAEELRSIIALHLPRPIDTPSREVMNLTPDILRDHPERNAFRPAHHSPDQSQGDISEIPFFPNTVKNREDSVSSHGIIANTYSPVNDMNPQANAGGQSVPTENPLPNSQSSPVQPLKTNIAIESARRGNKWWIIFLTLVGGVTLILTSGGIIGVLRSNPIMLVIVAIMGILSILGLIMTVSGGLHYISSGGDQSAITKAKNTILYGCITFIVTVSILIIIFFVLAPGRNIEIPWANSIMPVIVTATGILSILGLIMIFTGGVHYVTSSGAQGPIAKAKNTILYGCITFIIFGGILIAIFFRN